MNLRALSILVLAMGQCGSDQPPPPEPIPVTYGGDPAGRHMAYFWDTRGRVVTVEAARERWVTVSGIGRAEVPAGLRVRRFWSFVASDSGTCFEGNFDILDEYGTPLFPRAEHKEVPFKVYDAWKYLDPPGGEYVTTGPLLVRWDCRVGCEQHDLTTRAPMPGVFATRCHINVNLELAP